jgi:cell division protein FtsA
MDFPVVALEIGTSKTVALVGEMRDDEHIMITGMGETESCGIRKGEVTDLELAAGCVRLALAQAEKSGKCEIGSVHLAVSGGHIESMVNRGSVSVIDRSQGISDADVEQVNDIARSVSLPPEREVLHTIPRHYYIDSQSKVTMPHGMEGNQLSVEMLILHGVRARLNNVARVVGRVPREVSDMAFSGLCSALAVLSPQQKLSGVIVIDLGGGITDYLAYSEGVVAAAGAIGVGGDHVTNDIAIAFNIPTLDAENLKKGSGSAVLLPATLAQRVSMPGALGASPQSVSVKALHTVINARMEEILVLVRKCLEREGVLPHCGAGVVLTGGGALLRGAKELCERVFGLPVMIGRPRHVSGLSVVTNGPEYSTSCGLVQYAFRSMAEEEPSENPLLRVFKWLKGE